MLSSVSPSDASKQTCNINLRQLAGIQPWNIRKQNRILKILTSLEISVKILILRYSLAIAYKTMAGVQVYPIVSSVGIVEKEEKKRICTPPLIDIY